MWLQCKWVSVWCGQCIYIIVRKVESIHKHLKIHILQAPSLVLSRIIGVEWFPLSMNVYIQNCWHYKRLAVWFQQYTIYRFMLTVDTTGCLILNVSQKLQNQSTWKFNTRFRSWNSLLIGNIMTSQLIQNGGRPPSWKSLYRNISVKNWTILLKFDTLLTLSKTKIQ